MNSIWLERLRPLFPIAASVGLTLLASPLEAQRRPLEIRVHDVEGLYAAVNTDAHRLVRVHLAPGTYVLTSLDRNLRPRPHHGALRLPPGLSLIGSEKHVDTNGDGVSDPIDPQAPDDFAVPGTETTIDGSGLVLGPEERKDCAGQSRAIFPDPVIFVGRNNTISALSLEAGAHVGIGEPTNDPIDPTGSLSIEVRDTVIRGIAAVSFANSECAARRARSVLEFSHNVVRGGAAFGLLISNFYTGGDASNDFSHGPQIVATVAFNLFYDNNTALHATGGDEGTDGGLVKLHMIGNVFRSNQTNLQGRGGVGRGPELQGVGNRLVIESEFDTFGEAPSSIYLTAGTEFTLGSVLEAEFLHSRFLRDSADTPPEITIIGGEGGGSDNQALILIRRATVTSSEGLPVEGGLSIEDETGSGDIPNAARLEGTRRDFIESNQGLPDPPGHFFLGH